jgi:hypothetical protein
MNSFKRQYLLYCHEFDWTLVCMGRLRNGWI